MGKLEDFKVRLIVAGGRDFFDYTFLKNKLDVILSKIPKEDILIISGDAIGADTLGVEYAIERGITFHKEPADWYPSILKGKMDRMAGHKRNVKMGQMATHLVAFWDGHSSGTADMISIAKILKLQSRVVKYEIIF